MSNVHFCRALLGLMCIFLLSVPINTVAQMPDDIEETVYADCDTGKFTITITDDKLVDTSVTSTWSETSTDNIFGYTCDFGLKSITFTGTLNPSKDSGEIKGIITDDAGDKITVRVTVIRRNIEETVYADYETGKFTITITDPMLADTSSKSTWTETSKDNVKYDKPKFEKGSITFTGTLDPGEYSGEIIGVIKDDAGNKITVRINVLRYHLFYVGGAWNPIDKFSLVAPYIGLTAIIITIGAILIVFANRRKRQ